jgi:hypothetical protein
MKVLAENFLKKNLSCGYQCQNLFSEKISSFCGLYPKLDLHSNFSLVSSLNLLESPLKRLELSKGCFVCSGKTGLFGFRNWTIRFSQV